MRPEVVNFLAGRVPIARERQVWGGILPLDVASYLSDRLPPLAYVSSVRGLVRRDEEVLAVREGEIWHILPGGRHEGDEPALATLHREVREESGWTVSGEILLGFLHYHHLTSRHPGERWPHPDFFQPVYLARPERFLPDALLPNACEPDAYIFFPITEILQRVLPAVERCFLTTVLCQP